MDEKGLVANMLWRAGAKYPEPEQPSDSVSIRLWAQYVRDNVATVVEAVRAMREHPLQLVSDGIPGTDRYTTMHLSISDASGDNSIFEYIDGKLVIQHGRDCQVPANDLAHDQRSALASYWRDIVGTTALPGTNRSSDRFLRASFYIHAIPGTALGPEGVALVMSVMRNVSLPIGISTSNMPRQIEHTLARPCRPHAIRAFRGRALLSEDMNRGQAGDHATRQRVGAAWLRLPEAIPLQSVMTG